MAAPAEDGSFFDRLQALPPEDWQHLRVYLYRLWPVIDRKADAHFIARVQEPVDEEWVLANYGSGRYHARLNDTRAKKTLVQHTFSVHDPKRPPRVDPREVVASDPANDPYFEIWARPKEGKEAASAPPVVRVEDSAAAREAVRELGELARAAQARGVDPALSDLYLKTAERCDRLVAQLAEAKSDKNAQPPLALVNDVLALVERLQQQQKREAPPPQPARQPDSDPLATLDRVLNVIDKIRPAANSSDPLASVDHALAIFSKLRSLTAAEELPPVPTPGPTASAWEKVGAMIVSLLQPAMPVLAQALVARAAAPPPPGLGSAPAPPTVPVSLPPAAATAATVGTAPPTATAPASATAPPNGADAAEMQLVTSVAALAVNALNLGLTGDQFAEQLVYQYGERAYDQVVAIPIDALLTRLKGVPTAWALLAPWEAALPQFIEQFYAWGKEAPEATDAGSPASKPAAA